MQTDITFLVFAIGNHPKPQVRVGAQGVDNVAHFGDHVDVHGIPSATRADGHNRKAVGARARSINEPDGKWDCILISNLRENIQRLGTPERHGIDHFKVPFPRQKIDPAAIESAVGIGAQKSQKMSLYQAIRMQTGQNQPLRLRR